MLWFGRDIMPQTRIVGFYPRTPIHHPNGLYEYSWNLTANEPAMVLTKCAFLHRSLLTKFW